MLAEEVRMSVKRFVAADMRRALELVRQEMGDDAIILSSRRIKQGVEILTSVEPVAENPNALPLDNQGAEAEVAMPSDGAWAEQQQIQDAVAMHQSSVTGVSAAGMGGDFSSQGQSSGIAPIKAPIKATTRKRGLASGKTPAELAEEIEQARQRMMEARKAGANAEAPFSQQESLQESLQEGLSQKARSQSAEPLTFKEKLAAQEPFRQQAPSPSQVQASPAPESWAMDTPDPQKQQLESLQAELADMRLLLEDQLSRIAKAPRQSLTPLHASLERRLQHLGLSAETIQPLLGSVKETRNLASAWNEALATLAHQLPVSGDDIVARGGIFAFVGPTGVGKTTTITKLAARYVLEHGADKVALVTTDTYRIAAHDQLRSLGRILNVQVKVVDDSEDLPSVLRSLKGCELVLVDTAGLRHGDPLLKQQLEVLNQLPQVRSLLVMASNSQRQMLKATLHAYQRADLSGCILTKLDETASLGEALDVILERRLPLVYTTDGQDIPDDLELARGHSLVTQAVNLLKGQNANTGEAGEPMFSGVSGASFGATQGAPSIYTEHR
jgi:flagellar biosynthesis protein FlhF